MSLLQENKFYAPPTFEGPNNTSIENFVLSYAADYKKWNDYCMRVSESLREKPAAEKLREMDGFSELYRLFLTPFLADGVHLQLIAFGTSADFDPNRISILNIKNDVSRYRVFFSVASEHLDCSNDFFAEISSNDAGDWLLHQVFYIDPFPEDGKVFLPYL